MEVYLIRHTTPAIVPGLIYGITDVCLTDTFDNEKELILKQLPPKIEEVFSSPSSRCTALAAAISTNYITDKALLELNFGSWEGKTWDTINRDESNFWMSDFVNRHPPGGETMLEMSTRVLAIWNKILQQDYNRTAIVTHGGVIRIIWAYLNNIPLQDAFTLKVRFGEVFKIII